MAVFGNENGEIPSHGFSYFILCQRKGNLPMIIGFVFFSAQVEGDS